MKTVIWQVSPAADKCQYLGCLESDDIVHATAFSPSGKLLATGGEECFISLFLVDRKFEKASELQCPAGIRCLAWSPNCNFLASGGEDLQVSVWDIISETMVLQLPKAKDWLCMLAFTADSRWLASCGFGHKAVTLHAVEVEVQETPQQQNEGSEDEAEEPSTVAFQMCIPNDPMTQRRESTEENDVTEPPQPMSSFKMQ